MTRSTVWFPLLGLLVAGLVHDAALAESRRTAIVMAIESQRDSVVNIHGQKLVGGDDGTEGETRRVNGMGTGVVIDPRGYAVTNYHVVEGVRRIEVTLASGKTTAATLVSHDPRTDLAVIKIASESHLPVATIGTSSDLMIGETVLALGNAYGYEHTVTRGIVSALHRNVEVSRSQRYEDLIQTDASINPGNSGGPLLNINGEVIGINTAVATSSQNQAASNVGFAISARELLDEITALRSQADGATAVEGFLGVAIDDRSDGGSGALITEVTAGSPAAEAGFEKGDVVIAADGRPVGGQGGLIARIRDGAPGDTFSVTVLRDGEQLDLTALLVERKAG